MPFFELDTERILSKSRHWLELDQKWGTPVDLDDLQGSNEAVPVCTINSTEMGGFPASHRRIHSEEIEDPKSERILTVSCEIVLKNQAKIRLSVHVKREDQSDKPENSENSNRSLELEGYSADDENSTDST